MAIAKGNIFSKRLMIRRKALGLNQNELAEKLGIHGSAISGYENGRNYPECSMLPALAAALGTTIGYLFGEDGLLFMNEAGSPYGAQSIKIPERARALMEILQVESFDELFDRLVEDRLKPASIGSYSKAAAGQTPNG